jgi:hypothetical protein
MPGVRNKDQVMIGGWFNRRFAAKVDSALGVLSRSDFTRAALKEKLERMGIDVPDDESKPPSRLGKGGPRRKVVFPAADSERTALNETAPPYQARENPAVNLTGLSGAAKASLTAAQDAPSPAPKSARKPKAGAPTSYKRAPKRGGGKGS